MKGVVTIIESLQASRKRLLRLWKYGRLGTDATTKDLVATLDATIEQAVFLAYKIKELEIGRTLDA